MKSRKKLSLSLSAGQGREIYNKPRSVSTTRIRAHVSIQLVMASRDRHPASCLHKSAPWPALRDGYRFNDLLEISKAFHQLKTMKALKRNPLATSVL